MDDGRGRTPLGGTCVGGRLKKPSLITRLTGPTLERAKDMRRKAGTLYDVGGR